jgi:hypothetical protein
VYQVRLVISNHAEFQAAMSFRESRCSTSGTASA